MPRISQLPSLTAADNADELAIVDVSASTTKKITRGDLLKSPLPNNSVTTAAVANGAITADKLDWPTRINWSTSAVATGWSSTTVKDFHYQRIGNIVFFSARVEGASNGTTTTMSLPIPAAVLSTTTAMVLNNGNWGSGAAVIENSTVTLLTAALGNLSATGTKGFRINGFYFV